jgi:hypothetical protein
MLVFGLLGLYISHLVDSEFVPVLFSPHEILPVVLSVVVPPSLECWLR